ncbi:unnamed protein product [Bursaphelenchus okinawaensis]|uniref:[heparan sulfate]-glucosamine N-sulfotransferase n=1 Tax=Bursaphelenchus okinawaensis TaxID=465554 RepID=A0A811KUN1_9BILA|nr:unnamed protein product [Bursaphelenchus okinawaensis]CAG9111437.1 unnamed protein product [Bursaphelenchus okinawaensis]
MRKSSPYQHIILGHNLTNWIAKTTFIDGLTFLLGETWTGGLERYIQIDIDDIFVGQIGTRLVKDDISELIEVQKRWRSYFVDQFSFTLGFSGAFFGRGTEEEVKGDEELLRQSHHFLWFPHMWKHNHAHEYSYDNLTLLMDLNKQFAHSNNLNVTLNYAVSPQHHGVYPIHEPLYKAWTKVWEVKVTSTEEYPHFQPASRRRGFTYNGISVLPRQTCGLYTHTMYFHALPNGFRKFKENIEGGTVFDDILFNKIKWIKPTEMVDKYMKAQKNFDLYYTDECGDKRHLQGLSYLKKCDNSTNLPNLIILGPQKTGTTALAEFLKVHPDVATNLNVAGSFEEPQFFGQKNYDNGLDWYRALYNESAKIIFEKSANYFDNSKVALQMSYLLPKAKFLVILKDPVDRAYSWYQHMLAHNDSIASKYSLEHILKNKNKPEMKRLVARMINPGKYAQHFHRWLEHFNMDQFIIVDGNELKQIPSAVMNQLIKDLRLRFMDYRRILKFNVKKGYYCVEYQSKKKCLGASKGRKYDKMSEEARKMLQEEFRESNQDLKRLLRHFRLKLPYFLL